MIRSVFAEAVEVTSRLATLADSIAICRYLEELHP
jgi:glutathione S-transferase